MKVCYKNYPVLLKLQKGDFGAMEISREDQNFYKSPQWAPAYHLWKQNTPFFLNEVNLVSSTFMYAKKKALNRLMELYKTMIFSKEYDLNFNGTFFDPGGFTYLLRYDYNEKKDRSFQILYWFENNKLLGYFYLNDYREVSELWICEDYKRTFNINNSHKERQVVTNIIGRLLVIKLFKDCNKVEIRKLPPQSETIDVERNYINETHFEIEMLDSPWLFDLVNSDIFNDRGHFEVKACGKELKDHHLKWIREARPEYIPPARILKYIKINGG